MHPPLPKRHSRRLLLSLAALAAAALLTSVVAQPPQPAVPGRPAIRRILSFAASPGRWIWLSGEGARITLFQAPPGGAGAPVVAGPGWREVVFKGEDRAVILTDRGLLETTIGPGAAPQTLVQGLRSAGGLFAEGNDLYWLELAPGAPGQAFVPSAGPMLELRARRGDGTLATLGRWPASGDSHTRPGPRDILGMTPDHLYARVRRFAATEFVRFSRKTAEADRVAIENGSQEGVLHQGRLYWTARSEEASETSGVRAVRCLTGDGAARTLTDWLPSGRLISDGRSVWYAGEQLYRIPERYGASEPLRTLRAVDAILSGHSVISVDAAVGPHVVAEVR